MDKLVVFDLDDTLLSTQNYYEGPIRDAIRLIRKTIGPDAPTVQAILKMEEEIDRARLREINPATDRPFAYSMDRFPGSLVITYERLCSQLGITPLFDVGRELFTIGTRVFDENLYKNSLKPGAEELIKFFYGCRDFPVLLTRGDRRVQERKVSALAKSFGIVFMDVRIVEKKTPEIFTSWARKFGGCAKFSIGNEFESDIAPALEAGFKGILIPTRSWEFIDNGRMALLKKVEAARIAGRECVIFSSLAEIIEKYGEL